jgi:hypothetical protein
MVNNKRKTYFEVGRERRRLNNNEIKSKLLDFNKFLDKIGLALNSSQVIKIELKDQGSDHSNFRYKISNKKTEATEAMDQILKTLKVVDATHLSQRVYHKIRTSLDLKEELPPLNHLILMKKSVNNIIFELNVNRNGSFLKHPLQKVEFVLKKIIGNLDNIVINNDTFIIKLSGDGKVITKTKTEINNIVFTLINDEKQCKTSAGNYILGNFV